MRKITTLEDLHALKVAQALMRSGLWDRDDRDSVPTAGQILSEVSEGAVGGDDYDATYEARAIPKLW